MAQSPLHTPLNQVEEGQHDVTIYSPYPDELCGLLEIFDVKHPLSEYSIKDNTTHVSGQENSLKGAEQSRTCFF